MTEPAIDPRQISDAQWRERLTPEQYSVLRQQGTERAFAGEYWDNHDDGMYRCAGCGAELFASDTKFESGSGWPSFDAPIVNAAVTQHVDNSHGMRRVEVRCASCDGHLGGGLRPSNRLLSALATADVIGRSNDAMDAPFGIADR